MSGTVDKRNGGFAALSSDERDVYALANDMRFMAAFPELLRSYDDAGRRVERDYNGISK